ncbi:MAG: hypothetical protein WC822_07375 [Candidatus Paceibacterota bacterium]|jgi:hypothetical protein
MLGALFLVMAILMAFAARMTRDVVTNVVYGVAGMAMACAALYLLW